jgi:hypothetical protein
VTGYMHESLEVAVQQCLKLDTDTIKRTVKQKFTWSKCAEIFANNLIKL